MPARATWPAGIALAIVAVVAVVSAATLWHTPHGSDQHCVVCQFRQLRADEAVGSPYVPPADAREPLALTPRPGWIAVNRLADIPARAPPL